MTCPYCNTELEYNGWKQWSCKAICPKCNEKLFVEYDDITIETDNGGSEDWLLYTLLKFEDVNYLKFGFEDKTLDLIELKIEEDD